MDAVVPLVGMSEEGALVRSCIDWDVRSKEIIKVYRNE